MADECHDDCQFSAVFIEFLFEVKKRGVQLIVILIN